MKNDFFDNGGAKIKIPEKEQDLKSQVEALTKIVSEMKKESKKIELEKMKLQLNLSRILFF